MMKLFRTILSWLLLALFLILTFLACCWNWSQVLIDGHLYFIDADCYARMTRVQMVLEHPGLIIRHHFFENYPEGVHAHTTAPLDYLIALLSLFCRPFTKDALDWAGALVSPLLGVATGAFLWFWSRRAGLPFRAPMLLLFAISPVITHGFLFGRPDHQSLELFLLAIAIGAEWMLWKGPSRAWTFIGGAAWGLGLWVSLYEPLILLVAVLILRAVFFRRLFVWRQGLEGLALCLGIFLVALLIERMPLAPPDSQAMAHFKTWVGTVGEMRSATPLNPILYHWASGLLIVAPILFGIAIFQRKANALPAFLLVLLLYALTLWQLRWGYFLALFFIMTVPLQLAALRWRWLGWLAFLVALWPVAIEWDSRLYPDDDQQEMYAKQRLNNLLMREAAGQLQSPQTMPILAPWWICPALAYWSHQPAIAGSSHESLPGITDSARFFLSDNPDEIREILKRRQTAWVVAYEAETVIENSTKVLNTSAPANPLAKTLYEHPSRAPVSLDSFYRNPHYPYYKIYRVDQSTLF